MDLIADTTFLVGLWRGQTWATRFAVAHRESVLGIPWVVSGEFWHGALRAGHEEQRVRDFLSIGMMLSEPEVVVPHYAQLCVALQVKPNWKSIGQNDLWIAATAIAYQRPLVTRNLRHFDKIPQLQVEALEAANT